MNIPDKQLQIKDRAGKLYFQCEYGRPSAITVTIRDSSNNQLPTPIEGENVLANLSTVSTALTSAVEAGAEAIVVNSVVGITQEDEVLVGTMDVREWVQVEKIVGSTLYLYRPLRIYHALGAAVAKTHTYVDLVAGNNEIVDACRRAHWVVTVGGQTYDADTLYDVVLRAFQNPVTTATLYELDPDLGSYNHAEQKDFSKQIAAAVVVVGNRLRNRGLGLNNLMFDAAAKMAIAWATLWLLGCAWTLSDGSPGLEKWKLQNEANMKTEIELLLAAPVWVEDGDQDLERDSDEAEGQPRYLGWA